MVSAAVNADEIETLRSELADREARIKELELLVDYLRKKPFRPSSEALHCMIPLFDEAETSASETPKPSGPRIKVGSHDRSSSGGRKPLSEDLPREVVRHELAADERACTCCGGTLHEVGVEVTEQLDIIPQKMQVLRHERVKYGCRSCETGIKSAAMPSQPIPKSMASPSTLAHIAVSKYADHLPLYRQEAMWARLGVELDRGTLATWMVRAGSLVQPLVNLLLEDIKEDGVVCMDETTVQVLQEKNKKPTSSGYMWVMSRAGPGPRAVIFEYDPSRSGRVADRLLDDFRGTVVTDGFKGYKHLAARGITRAGCWAHVRRKFVEAAEIEGKEATETVAKQAILLIGKLYEIERSGRDLDAAARQKLRQGDSRRITAEIESLLNANIARLPPKSPTGRALFYLRDEWQALQIYLHDGRVPIDNNRVENAIRPFALGRKNWMFSATPSGARASASLYTLIETAKANGLDPHAYMGTVFAKLPGAVTAKEVEALLPYP
jgi:transposase